MDPIVRELDPVDLVTLSLSYRAAQSAADHHLQFHRVFRNPHYDPEYALKFQELLPIVESNQYLRDHVTVQDIASAYDRLKVDVGTDQVKI